MRRLFLLCFLLTPYFAQAQTPGSLAQMLFMQTASKITRSDAVLCLSVDKQDIADSELSMLRRSDARFVAASSCTPVSNPEKGSYHTATGKPAYFVSVFGFTPETESTARIQINMIHHGKHGDFQTIRVEREDGSWRIQKILEHSAA